VFHLYVIRANDRDELMQHLKKQGIQAGIHYPVPVHRQEAYQSREDDLKITDACCNEILSLPMYPELGDNIDTVCSAVIDFYKKN
jgi:dTDP-3-amino-3,4,6-trideoxy-alpha-D-glucose transaminase